ncbi:MAG TPA: hypothetical protein VFE55_09785 [Acidimicrobiia bacterium]|nr:hypothetical protein [Acidimicrobiia bacterium]
MIKHFLRSKAPIRAVAVLAALASGVVLPPAAQAVRPGRNGRVAYLKDFSTTAVPRLDVVVFDGRFNHRLTNSGDFLGKVTWCDSETLVAAEAGAGIVVLPIDHESTVGTPYTIYDDPTNTLKDPACDPSGRKVAAAVPGTKSIVTIPVNGRHGLTSPVATTALGGIPSDPTWSSSGDYIAYVDNSYDDASGTGDSVIEVAAASRHFVGSGTVVTPSTPNTGFRFGPSWREDTIYYWKSLNLTGASQGIFSVKLGDLNEFGPYGGTQAEKCIDPAARPDGDGFLCVGADTFIKVFPGPRTLINTDARKPDVERLSEEHHHDDHHHFKKACACKK